GDAAELEAAVATVHGQIVLGRREGHLPALEQRVDGVDVTGQGEHEPERQVGDGVGVAAGGGEHRNLQLGRPADADVDRIATAAADQAEGAVVEHVFVDEVRFDDQDVGSELVE